MHACDLVIQNADPSKPPRMTGDSQLINEFIAPIPSEDPPFEAMGFFAPCKDSTWFYVSDLTTQFFQLPVRYPAALRMYQNPTGGNYVMNVVPMGGKNSSRHAERAMRISFADLPNTLYQADGILIHAPSVDVSPVSGRIKPTEVYRITLPRQKRDRLVERPQTWLPAGARHVRGHRVTEPRFVNHQTRLVHHRPE